MARSTPVRPVAKKRRSDHLRRNKRLRRHLDRRRSHSRPDPLRLWSRTVPAPRFRDTAILKIPQRFSFITDPEEALDTLNSMVTSLNDPRVGSVFFDHSDCELLDLDASAVMDALFLAKKGSFRRGSRISALGSYSKKNDDVNVLLISNGIIRNLDVARPRDLPVGLRERLRIFPLKRGFKSPPWESSDVERTSTFLVEFFDSCLRMEGFRLKDDKRSNLMDLVAETVNNAEEHSGQPDSAREPSWYAIGYHKGSEVPGRGGECHIVLFNFGRSVYDSLRLPETSEKLKEEISRLADTHRRNGFFEKLAEITRHIGIFRVRWWQEDALWTLYALQEGVSRFRHLPGAEDRGNGTVRMIGEFLKLASNDPRMIILSGRTWILFDGKHSMRTVIRNGEERKVIAFNAENDLYLPPDANYVRTLDGNFPGTLVSLKFTLRNEDLAKVSEGLSEDDDR
jgi:hypothetical protein